MEQPRAINNPMLVGAMELLKADNSKEHRDFFLQELLKAQLITPATVTPRPSRSEDGGMRMQPGSQIQIPMLTTRKGVRYFMAFTDMAEMKKWIKSLEEDMQVFVFGFSEYASMVKKADSQCDGFSINPGGINVKVTREMIDTIQTAMASQNQPEK